MTTSTLTAPAPTRVRPLAVILPGAAALLYAGIQLDGGVIVAALRSTSTVPDDRLNFPLSGGTAVTAELVWSVSQIAFVIAVAGFRRSPAVGSRGGRIGSLLALLGGLLFLCGHAVCLLFPDARVADPAGVTGVTLFAAGSVLIAVGFLAAGIAVLHQDAWSGWRRLAPLAVGAWMVLLIPLQFTGLLQAAVAVHALTVAAFAVAMLIESDE